MRITNHICRLGIFPKSDEIFRLSGQEEGKFHYLTGNQFVLGSSKEVEFPVAGNGIIDNHLRVTIKGREIWLESLGASPNTLVSGKHIPPNELFPYKSGELIQLGQSHHVFNLELFNRFLEPQVEADAIVEEARRQIEEKNRKAIEESHGRAKGILHQAKTEAETLTNEAKSVANDLIESAKNEVELLLKQGQVKAEKVAQEGEVRKSSALQTLEALQKEIVKIQEEKNRLVDETSQCKVACVEATQKRQSLLHQNEETLNQHLQLSERLKNLQVEVKKAEKDWETQLGALKGKAKTLEEQMHTSQNLKDEAEKNCQNLKAQSSEFEKRVATLTSQHEKIRAEIEKSATEKDKCKSELDNLKHKFQSDLAQLRVRVDDEYKRQLKNHEIYILESREKEILVQTQRQKSLEKLEARRFGRQVAQTQERLWKMISERAVLFGLADLKENLTFKKDLQQLTAQTMTEEFELRRQELLSTMPSPKALVRKQRVSYNVTRFAGWAISFLLLGLLVYGQIYPMATAERNVASVRPVNPHGDSTSPTSHFGINTLFGH